MKWPWRRHDRTSTDEALRHRDEAAIRLERATDRWPEVRDLVDWTRDRRRQNHLTELFYASRAKHLREGGRS